MLVSVCDKFSSELYSSLAEATAAMRKEMIAVSNLSEDDFAAPRMDDCKYGYDTMSGYITDGANHCDFDWRIVPIDAAAGESTAVNYDKMIASRLLEVDENRKYMAWIIDFRDDPIIASLLVQVFDVNSNTLVVSYRTGDKILARIVFHDLCNEIETKGNVNGYDFHDL